MSKDMITGTTFAIIITIFVIFLLFYFEEKSSTCEQWQKDTIECRDNECCKKLREFRPYMCHIPKTSCSIYE